MSSIVLNALMKAIPPDWRRHVKSVPGLAYVQRRLVSTLLNGREFPHKVDAGPAKGISFLIRLPEDKGIWTGTYEHDLASRIAAAVQPGTVGYDIGGWHGFFSGVMAANGAREVHVFEPLPLNIGRIRKLIELNTDKSITLHEVALGASDAEMSLLIMPETSMTKLEISAFQNEVTSQNKLRVRVRSLDSIVHAGEIMPPSLVKIDVEGAELLVLQGAQATLREHHPEIFAEVHSPALLKQCMEFLTAANYRVELVGADCGEALTKDVCQVWASVRSAA